MKTIKRLAWWSVVGGLALSRMTAADAPVVPEAIKSIEGSDIALDFFSIHPMADAVAWTQYLKDNGIVAEGDAARAAQRVLDVLQKTVASGVSPGSKFFWSRCERGLGAKVDAPSGGGSTAVKPPSFSATDQKKFDDLLTKLGHDQGLAQRYAEQETSARSLAFAADQKTVLDPAAYQLMMAARKQKLAYQSLAHRDQGSIDAMAAQLKTTEANLSPTEQADRRNQQTVAAGREQAQGEDLVLTPAKLPILDVQQTGGLPFYVMIGTRATTPYTIADGTTTPANSTTPTPKGTINTSSSTLRPFIELGYTTFWAMDPEHKAAWPGPIYLADPRWRTGVRLGEGDKGFHLWNGIDVDGHLNAFFNESDKVNATTIVGSGDFNAELNLDKLLYAAATDQVAWSVALGTRVGGSASRSDRTVHPDYFVGPRINLAHVVANGADRHMSLFRFGVGASRVDALRYDPASAKTKVLFDGDVPQFDGRWVPALEADAIYPVPSGGMVKIGARLYDRLEPNPWSVYIGYTIRVDDLFRSLLGFRKNNEPPTTPTTDTTAAKAAPATN